MPTVSRSWPRGFAAVVVALSLARVAFAVEPLSDDQQTQIAAVLSSAGNGLGAVDSVLVQFKAAHLKLADYQNPKSPDPVLKSANALEINFADHVAHENALIKKDLSFAGNTLSGDGQYQALTDVVNSLTGVDNDLKHFQDILARSDIADARSKSRVHLAGVLDAWSAAHPGVDTELIAQIRTMSDPQQVDDAIQSQRMIITQVIDILNADKSGP